MITLQQRNRSVKTNKRIKKRGKGRPPKVDQSKEAKVIAHFLKCSIIEEQMPNDGELAQEVNLGERTVRQIRLNHGLCRWTLAGWLRVRPKANHNDEANFLCYTPFAGIWLLIPLILNSALSKAIGLLEMPAKCTIAAWQLVLTILL